MFKLILKKKLWKHEMIKLPTMKDISKFLKYKIYFTLSLGCHNVDKNTVSRSLKSLESLQPQLSKYLSSNKIKGRVNLIRYSLNSKIAKRHGNNCIWRLNCRDSVLVTTTIQWIYLVEFSFAMMFLFTTTY